MNFLSPIFTEKRACEDCYKCVRNCPVKAIKVESGVASVIPELCIFCGHCVEVCPNGAKKVRDDVARARQLLGLGKPVLVSLAPSYITEFPDVAKGQIVAALKRLGFSAISETALGAQQVSAQAAQALNDSPGRVLFSSACPTVVRYLQRHRQDVLPHLTGLLSPLLTHCRMLKQWFGPEAPIVFIGPCIAKKLEAAQHPELLDVAITFEDLRTWFDQEKIEPLSMLSGPNDHFVPEPAAEGTWYPVDGGMIAGMKSLCAVNDGSCMSFSGMRGIERALEGVEDLRPAEGLFLELLACEGGCVNGPRASKRTGTAAKRSAILRQKPSPETAWPRRVIIDAAESFGAEPAAVPQHTEAQIREALRQVGKFSRDDELNCGGCGYDSCVAFGAALVAGKAERSMCVTYMRKLAHKKVNALMQKMPSAVVIVNDAMRIVESNAAFVKLFCADLHPQGRALPPRGPSTVVPPGLDILAKESHPQLLEGVMLSEVMPFASLFHTLLKSGEDILERDLRHQSTILHATIFTIEKHSVIGGIIQDITEPAVRKEQVIRKAREVIQRSLETTQKIACLLGENAAESEITLNSIIDSFTPPKPEDPKVENDWRKLYRP